MASTTTGIQVLKSSYINTLSKKLECEPTPINREFFLPIMFTNYDYSIVNALRRIGTTELETYAFDPKHIKIMNNISQYNSEVLIDRLGFITLNQQIKNLSEMTFFLCDEHDPEKPLKNTTSKVLDVSVYKYLKVFTTKTPTHEGIKVISPHDSLLMTLNPNESIHVMMTPIKGTGRQHARWQSSIIMYKFGTEGDRIMNKPNPPEDLIETNKQQMAYIGSEQKIPVDIILTIESIGKIPSELILQQSIKHLIQKIEVIKNLLIKPNLRDEMDLFLSDQEKVLISDKTLDGLLVKLKINGEDHTLGHVLEYACMTHLWHLIHAQIPKEEDQYRVRSESLCVYRKPHPLDDYIELIVRLPQTPLQINPVSRDHSLVMSFIIESLTWFLKEVCQVMSKQIDNLFG